MEQSTAENAASPRGRVHLWTFARNWLGYGYGQVVSLAVQFLQVPFFIRYWGTPKYAGWLVLAGLPMMLTLLDFGTSQASASRATMRAAAGNPTGARETLQTALVFSTLICGFIFTASIAAGRLVNWRELLNIGPISQEQARYIVICMSGYLCASFYGNFLDAWFRTIGRAATGAFLLANRRALDIALSISVLLLHGGPKALALALFGGQWAALLMITLFAARSSPWPVLGVRHAKFREFRYIWRPALGYAGFPISQAITLQGGLQMLAQLASPNVVVAYSMSRTLMRSLMQIGMVSSNALRPLLSKLIGMGDIESAKAMSVRIGIVVAVLALAGYSILVAIGPSIVLAWGQHKINVTHGMLALIGLHALLNAAWFVPATFQIAGNAHARMGVSYAALSASALAAWFALRHSIDPFMGAALLLAAPEAALLTVMITPRLFTTTMRST